MFLILENCTRVHIVRSMFSVRMNSVFGFHSIVDDCLHLTIDFVCVCRDKSVFFVCFFFFSFFCSLFDKSDNFDLKIKCSASKDIKTYLQNCCHSLIGIDARPFARSFISVSNALLLLLSTYPVGYFKQVELEASGQLCVIRTIFFSLCQMQRHIHADDSTKLSLTNHFSFIQDMLNALIENSLNFLVYFIVSHSNFLSSSHSLFGTSFVRFVFVSTMKKQIHTPT